MADTEMDFIMEAKEADLNLTEDHFIKWLEYNAAIRVSFLKGCYKPSREAVMAVLHDLFWDDFADDMEFADGAAREKDRLYQGSNKA